MTTIKWSYEVFSHRAILDTLLLAAFYLSFAAAIFIPRARKEVVDARRHAKRKMSRLVQDRDSRRCRGAGVTEFALARAACPLSRLYLDPERPKSNFLLITFDALSAEDMSLYGYKLPAPNIDDFARKATVFTNFYSSCTFTTPCVADVLDGDVSLGKPGFSAAKHGEPEEYCYDSATCDARRRLCYRRFHLQRFRVFFGE